ncbi:hypothetical protein BAE44_0022230 [Dichanthelium oligosanthes]|uniref:Uncharacterized protein n=1 Tax=Dichanthelium oligosanthes TaxID=888268 RepID=A0A1E5UV50_9POAL|nr:hypothetical protein BAE44_0022230 [Dichanthelium oligosanthes]
MSYIESDKLSLPEVMEHLKDHYKPSDPVLLHWLFSGKQLVDGLRALVDDKSCKDMSHCVSEGGVADVYVEVIVVDDEEMEKEEESDRKVEARRQGKLQLEHLRKTMWRCKGVH